MQMRVFKYKNPRVAKRHWPYLFSQPPLSGWSPSFLVTSGTFCSLFGWVAAEATGLSRFPPFSLSRCFPLGFVCVFPFVSSSQAILGLELICQHESSFLSEERSIHLFVTLGMAPESPQSLQQSHRGWCFLKCAPCFFLLSVLPEISQLILHSASWEAELQFERISGLTEARSWSTTAASRLFFLTVCFLAFEEVGGWSV